MQMPGDHASGLVSAVVALWRQEGYRGFYRGMAANALRVLPHNGMRFVAYEAAKGMLGVERRATDT